MSISTSQHVHFLRNEETKVDLDLWDADWRVKKFQHMRGQEEDWIVMRTHPYEEKYAQPMNISLNAAIGRYEAGLVSLGRAAEIAGLPYDKMMDELYKRGIPLRFGPASLAEAERRGERLIAALKQLRRSS